MSGPSLDVLVVGDLNPDLVLWGDDVVPRFGQQEQLVAGHDLTVGGSGAITACGLARLGMRVGLVAMVGDDEFGRLLRSAVERRGVSVGRVVAGNARTGLSVILTGSDDRAILTSQGAMAALPAQIIDEIEPDAARHLHLASPFLIGDGARRRLAMLAERMGRAGGSVSLDPNWDPHGEWGLTALLEHVDVLLPNLAEAKAIAAREDETAAVDRLLSWVPTVALKTGERGGYLRTTTEFFRSAPPPEVAVADTIGAGDSFDAGYLAARLRSLPESVAIDWAVAAGTLSTRCHGGVDGQATVDEIEHYLG